MKDEEGQIKCAHCSGKGYMVVPVTGPCRIVSGELTCPLAYQTKVCPFCSREDKPDLRSDLDWQWPSEGVL